MMNRYVGSDFDDFLRDEGMLADAEADAIERVVALQPTAIIKERRNSEIRDGSAGENESVD